ncbi:MAG: hypothetical protein ACRCZS_30080 [Chroococcidiopsis sp.]
MYRIFRNDLGIVDAINLDDGASLPYNPITKSFDESDPLTIALRSWEQEHGELDLSDRESEPIIEPQRYSIYNYIDADDPYKFPGYIVFPDSLDTYLPKKQKILYGERTQTLYFDGITNESVIQVDYKFNRDAKGLLLSTERSISFYLENGSLAEQKKVHLIPSASQFEQLEELKRRRTNIVAEVQSLAVSFNLINEMNELYDTQSASISRYLETGSPLFKNFLKSDNTRNWLKAPSTVPGKTIKDILVGYFSIGLLHD